MSESNHPFISTPNGTLLKMSVPVLFSLIAEPLTGLADTAFVARLPGAAPVAALGVGTMAFTSIFWAFTFLGVGTQTEVAQAEGRRDHEQATRVASLASIMAAGIGTALMLLMLPFLEEIALLLGGQGEVNTLACEYMRYRLLGAPAVLVTLACFGALRGVQDMRTPLYVAVGINVINILLDWVLIFGHMGLPVMGVAGAALASTISQWIGSGWALWVLSRKLGFTFNIHGAGIAKLVRIGGDLFIRTGSVLLFLSLCTRVANLAGPNEGAAYQAIRQFFIFSALFLDAFALTGQSLIGYFLGANDRGTARKVAGLVCFWSVVTGCILCIGMLVGQEEIIWLLVPEQAVAVFIPAWWVVALTQPVGSLSFATDGIHWGAGDFRYLRNAMLIASATAATIVVIIGSIQVDDVLIYIWLATAVWTCIRAGLGLVRVWPGVGDAPLGKQRGAIV